MTYQQNNSNNTNNSNSQSSSSSNTETLVMADSPALTGFLNDQYIKNIIHMIKLDDETLNSNEMTVTDRRRSFIMDIAEHMEVKMNQNGSSWMINEISRYLNRIFEKMGLEKHSYLIYEVLPDKYKDKTKNTYKLHQSRILANQYKRYYNKMNAINMSLLEPEDLYEIKNISIAQTELVDKELLLKDHPLSKEYDMSLQQHNPLEDLKTAEKNKFKPAKIGEPLSTAEELCQDPTYAKEFEELKKTLDQAVRGHEIMREWFTQKYPPLSVDHVIKLTKAFKVWNELMRPYFDRKYRRDHIQSIKTAYMRVLHTSTKASHESQIPCAHYLDKNGLPVMRGLTKEQIDAMYEWEINFQQLLVNTFINWVPLITEVNAAHGGRCGEDRAMALSDTLSHHA